MIDQRSRSPFRDLVAAVALAASVALMAAQPTAAQPLPPTPVSVPSPQVTKTNLTIRSTAPSTVEQNKQFTFRFSVYRYYQFGPDVSQRITVRHWAPPSYAFINQYPAPGFTCDYTASLIGNVLDCTGIMTASAPGSVGTATFSARYSAPNQFEGSNTNTLRATVDPNDAISEIDEGDNVATSTINIPLRSPF